VASDDAEQMRFSPSALRVLRERANLSQRALAEACGIALRSIARFESGEVEPRYSTALRIAEVLDVDMTELSGDSPGVELGGAWHARWQTALEGDEVVTEQGVHATQSGLRVSIYATERGSVITSEGERYEATVERGGYRWDGELRLSSDHVFIGSYSADDGGVRSRGSLYFVLAPGGGYLHGRWVGSAHDGIVSTGWGVLARDAARAASVMTHLLADGRP